MSELTQAELIAVLRYEPDTGHFYWIKRVNNRCKMDVPAGTVFNDMLNKKGKDGKLYKPHFNIGIRINKKRYYAHRLAFLYMTGTFPINIVDHINGDSTDNRFENMRDVSNTINSQNVCEPRGNNKSGYLGVCFNKTTGMYWANINVNGKYKRIGSYETAERAADAYFNAKYLLHEGMINERFDA